MKPLISIILPTYKEARFIIPSIESVLLQSFSDWELIIIDDGLYDASREHILDFIKNDTRIIFLKNEKNLGIQKTLNKGLMEARGIYIARIDDDDQWIDQDKLRLQVEYMQMHTDCVIVGTGAITVNEKGKELVRYLAPTSDIAVRNNMLTRNCFVHSSVLFRKDAVSGLDGYSESKEVKHVEDYDLWLKLGQMGTFANISIYGVRFLLASHNISSKHLVEQYRKNIVLAKKYKKQYPNYYRGIGIAYIRYIGALLFAKIIPTAIRAKIIGMYKKIIT